MTIITVSILVLSVWVGLALVVSLVLGGCIRLRDTVEGPVGSAHQLVEVADLRRLA